MAKAKKTKPANDTEGRGEAAQGDPPFVADIISASLAALAANMAKGDGDAKKPAKTASKAGDLGELGAAAGSKRSDIRSEDNAQS